jgi:hypothetical protein
LDESLRGATLAERRAYRIVEQRLPSRLKFLDRGAPNPPSIFPIPGFEYTTGAIAIPRPDVPPKP